MKRIGRRKISDENIAELLLASQHLSSIGEGKCSKLYETLYERAKCPSKSSPPNVPADLFSGTDAETSVKLAEIIVGIAIGVISG